MNKPIDKKKRIVEEQIFYNLMQVVQAFPQYSLAQHLSHILRRKSDSEEFYYWNDEKVLKKFEDYIDELNGDLKPAI